MVESNKKLKVSIIILTTNALSMTLEQLRNISDLETKDLDAECIVIDNGSTDGTEKAIKNYILKNMSYKFLENGSNLGFAGGNNPAIDYAVKAGSDYILLMNNDMIVPGNLVKKLVDFMEKNVDCGVASPKMYFAEGYEFHKDKYEKKDLGHVIWYAGGLIDWKNMYCTHRGVDDVDKGQYEKTVDTDFANGACMIIRRDVFKRAGLFDKSYFLYWEDADFLIRTKKLGFGVKYFPGTHLWHKVSVSTGGSGSPSNDYFLVRNRLYFALKYASPRTKFAVYRDTLKLALTGRAWQQKGARDAILCRKGIGSWIH